ncbi:MAG: ribbon-helix-helix domain-containing protein [Candidatus Bathyarchaeota archaeon]|nr:ribbon-helix-helix domain-containing protein [Candidatus Bathyarchaeota archaeon]
MSINEDEYTTVRLPKELMEVIDNIIKSGVGSYKSRAEFIKEALRRRFEELKILAPTPELPQLEHFNISEHGVRILDRSLANGTSKGRIIDVYFKPNKVLCEYCGSDNCRHVEFALNIPKVRKILIGKGWEISKRIKET